MESNDTAPLTDAPDDEVFEFGDQTICRMWRQPFDPEGNPVDAGDLGAMVIRPLRPSVAAVEATAPAAEQSDEPDDLSTITVRPHGVHAPRTDDERLARLEAKVEALTLALETLQKALSAIQESIAATR